MKPTRTRCPVIVATSGLVCALALLGCGGPKLVKTDGASPPQADGALVLVDVPSTDALAGSGGASAAGGSVGSGGTSAYDAAISQGGGGIATGGSSGNGPGGVGGIDVKTNDVDAPLGGSGSVTQTGGVGVDGGPSTSMGGARFDGGTVRGGSGGAGGSIGRGWAGGNGGSGGSAAKQDAADAAWWANDAGLKACPPNIGCYPRCDVGGPSICVVSGTYDAYQCNQYGVWSRQPDSCPGLLVSGDTCTGQFTCLYPSYWYCDCTAGMGFPAKCGDVRDLGMLDPRDASVPVDSAPLPILPCPADTATAVCDYSAQHYCSQPTGRDLCMCVSGAWTCYGTPCPATVNRSTPCSTTQIRCLGDDGTACGCFVDGFFMCGS